MEEDRLLLLVEDDAAFARTLKRSFERRGYRVLHATSGEEVQLLLTQHRPQYAVMDLKLAGNASGLNCVQMLHLHNPDALIVVLTGYASIATAVEAVKLGACHYLAKPSNTDDIEAAFGRVEAAPTWRSAARPPPSRRWNGSIFTRPWPSPASTSPRPHAAWACTGARWRASWKSARSSDWRQAQAAMLIADSAFQHCLSNTKVSEIVMQQAIAAPFFIGFAPSFQRTGRRP
jgi:ActR/RegA family two-component response regulator